jgi:succinylglutamate desuccinylase
VSFEAIPAKSLLVFGQQRATVAARKINTRISHHICNYWTYYHGYFLQEQGHNFYIIENYANVILSSDILIVQCKKIEKY